MSEWLLALSIFAQAVVIANCESRYDQYAISRTTGLRNNADQQGTL